MRLPIVGRWKLPGISGKYPRVSGVSIPQISSYIHVTPHLCARGTLNSVTCQYPDIITHEDLKWSMFIREPAKQNNITQSKGNYCPSYQKEFAYYSKISGIVCLSTNI